MSTKLIFVPSHVIEQTCQSIIDCPFHHVGDPPKRVLSVPALSAIWNSCEYPSHTVPPALKWLHELGLLYGWDAEHIVLTDAGFAARSKQ